jgi:hypothetical protein
MKILLRTDGGVAGIGSVGDMVASGFIGSPERRFAAKLAPGGDVPNRKPSANQISDYYENRFSSCGTRTLFIREPLHYKEYGVAVAAGSPPSCAHLGRLRAAVPTRAGTGAEPASTRAYCCAVNNLKFSAFQRIAA